MEIYCSQFWRLEVQDQGVSRVSFFYSLSLQGLRVSSHGLSSVSLSCLLTSHIRSATTSVTSFHFNHFFKDHISKYSHIWGTEVRISAYEIGGDAVQPVTPTKSVFTFEKDPQRTFKLEKYCPGPATQRIKHQWVCLGVEAGKGEEAGVSF